MMRSKKHGKWLGLILCVSMMLNLFPTAVFATGLEPQVAVEEMTEEQDTEVLEESEATLEESKENVEEPELSDAEPTENEEKAESKPESTEPENEPEATEEEPEPVQVYELESEELPEQQVELYEAAQETAAAVTAVKLAEVLTGSGDLDDKCWNKDTDENRGYDNSVDNDIIRSFDSIVYKVSATVSAQEGDSHKLVYEVTLPDDEELTLDESAMNAEKPIPCQKNSDGTKTYVCQYDLASGYAGGEKEENVIVKVGNKHQGDTIKPTIKAYLDEDTGHAQTVMNMETVTVTTAPMYNIVLKKKTNEDISRNVYDFRQKSENGKTYYPDNANGYPDNKVTGYRCTYGVALEIRKPGNGIKGVELPDLNQDFAFDVDISDATLNGKKLAETGFLPLLYYSGPNEGGGGAVVEIPFTKQYTGNGLDGMGCLDSGTVTMTQTGTTLHVTVKDFKIDPTQFPKQNYAGTSYWEDLNKIWEGIFSAFQFQVVYPYVNEKGENLQEKLGNGTVNAAAEVKNMNAVSETGISAKNETHKDDNKQSNSWTLESGNKRNQQIFYSSRKNMIDPYLVGKIWNDGDMAPVGAKDLAFTVTYDENNLGPADSIRNMPVAIDQFVLFDRSAIQNVDFSNAVQSGTDNPNGYQCKVLYAVRKAGRMDNESMRTASLEDFDFYDTRPEAGCDGVMVRYRGANLGNPQLTLRAQFTAEVKPDAEIADKVYMITAFTKTWTAAECYTGADLNMLGREALSTWAKGQPVKAPTEMKEPALPVLDNRGYYTVPNYVDGVYTVDETHKCSITSADALYLVPYIVKVAKTVAQTNENGQVPERYNIGKGQRYVDYRISSAMEYKSNVQPAAGSTTTVYFEDTLPVGLTYVQGSAYWGGTYTSRFPQMGKVEGGLQIEPSVSTNNDGKTVLKWEIQNVALRNGELPSLYYSCRIGRDVLENTNLKNEISIQTTEDRRPIYAELDNLSSAAITVARDKEFYIVKRGDDRLELQDQSCYELVASNTSSADKKNLWMFDTMPWSGDGKSEQIKGDYRITSLTMDAAEVNHASDMEIWYTNEKQYIGKTANDIDPSEVKEENGWKKATALGHDSENITFTGDGLIDGWPTVIAYYDENLERNTIATLRLEYIAAAGAEKDIFTNTWSTMSNGAELSSSADTEIYNRTLEGIVWIDKNKDGKIDDEEKRLGGVKVTLLRKDADGNYVPYTAYRETVNGSVYQCPSTLETDENGHYKFTGLPAGEYRVIFESSDGTSIGQYDVTKADADEDVTKTSKVKSENKVRENEKLISGTIVDITMPTLEEMVESGQRTYHLPDQNLGLILSKSGDLEPEKPEDGDDTPAPDKPGNDTPRPDKPNNHHPGTPEKQDSKKGNHHSTSTESQTAVPQSNAQSVTEVAKTGDDTSVAGWLAVSCLSCAAIAFVVCFHKADKKRKKRS